MGFLEIEDGSNVAGSSKSLTEIHEFSRKKVGKIYVPRV